jgi:hypothetical protein
MRPALRIAGNNTTLIDFVLGILTMRAGTACEVRDVMDTSGASREQVSFDFPNAPGRSTTENGAVKGTAARTIKKQPQILASMSCDSPNALLSCASAK